MAAAQAGNAMTVESPSSAAAVTETSAAIHFESSNDVIREGAPPSDAADDALAREDKNHTGTEVRALGFSDTQL